MTDSDVVIRVEGLGKRYALHHEQPERYRSLRDSMARRGKAASRWLNPFTLGGQLVRARRQAATEKQGSEEEFWALKDVSFEVRRGERLGIIGRNGAGKSTLLKILSRITEPTTGRVEIRGRVASLLEVGTGFHPELTGRENIDLNGAILGMTRREIRAKFDEIVAFAEVEKFLDTPVKRYSSGMYVRLAFAVAAHLEPEILVVDEVLAVGDASFQKKCLGKMEDVADREGRTVLFVSHQMAAIENLCNRAILLSHGSIGKLGDVRVCIGTYLSEGATTSLNVDRFVGRKGNGMIRARSIHYLSPDGSALESVQAGSDFIICITIETMVNDLKGVIFSISAKSPLGSPVFLIHNRMTGDKIRVTEGRQKVRCMINRLALTASVYALDLSIIQDGDYLDYVENAASLHVVDGDFYGTGEIPPYTHAVTLLEASWSVNP